MTEEQIPQEERKFIKDIIHMGIAGSLKSIQASHIFNLENEVEKLYSLFFTLEDEKINKEYILEKINCLLVRKPLSLSYEATLLAYCLNRELINHYEKDENLLAVCEQAVRKEGIVNFKPLDNILDSPNLQSEKNDEAGNDVR